MITKERKVNKLDIDKFIVENDENETPKFRVMSKTVKLVYN